MSLADRTFRAGVAGAGLMGRWHAEAIKRAGGRVVAVADLDLAAARKLAARFPGAAGFASVEQMLEQVALDVVHICTPLESHVPLAEAVIKAGLHLLVEKPLAPTAAEAARLLELAGRRGTRLCPVHQFIFQDGARKARAWLPGIGRIVSMQGAFYSAGGDGGPEQQKDRIAADILPHPLSLMQAFSPGCLAGGDWRVLRPAAGEWWAWSQAGETDLAIHVSMAARPPICAFQIAGTRGTIHLDLFHGYAYLEPGGVSRGRKVIRPFESAVRRFWAAAVNLGKRVVWWEPAYPGLRRLVHDFYASVVTGGAPPISGEDAVAVAAARDRLLMATGGDDV